MWPAGSRTIAAMKMSDTVHDFLEAPRVAALATTDDDGAPRQSVVWYLMDDEGLIVNSLVGRRWPSNLLTRPSVALAIVDTVDFWRWVGLTGTAEVLREGAGAQADIAAMTRRYHHDDPARAEALIRDRFSPQQRVSYRITITGIHDHL
jgi:PPOX class probable F420-dependent enzyme